MLSNLSSRCVYIENYGSRTAKKKQDICYYSSLSISFAKSGGRSTEYELHSVGLDGRYCEGIFHLIYASYFWI
jgi:hypothetical protein